ncbi:helix-turn-helix domain-containing protein [Alicyclobacillus fastidiosus]|uniref:DUF4115 domain-containing protein n=1 Tax=Alicyclobacillus fastidiosus TaxID=392011 RepID=A0ABV5AII5_9BACL|nr:RodZ domain-containing protein [Alicyclobacillus fastidiosus]WEH07869.1 DUF4115 domain-containing protein [Alicyclobacillus fastidiosus]
MRELGRILRSTRESLGFDLDEIEEKTKIRKRYLLALEEGDWTVLPGRVYARGFVRSYADVLGLDGLELLQQHVDGREVESPVETVDKVARPTPPEPVREEPSGSVPADSQSNSDGQRKAVARITEPRQPVEAPRKPAQVQPRQERSSRRFTLGGGVGQGLIIVAALAVVAGGYFALRGHHNPPTKANTGTASAVHNTSSATTGNQTTNAVSANTTANTTTNSASKKTTTKPPAAAVVTTGPVQNGAHTYTVKNVQKLKVQLKVQTGQLWIQAQSDSKMVDPNDILNPGDTRTFSGTTSILLRLGHVQGVQLTVNGQPVTLPDTPNAVNILIQKQ